MKTLSCFFIALFLSLNPFIMKSQVVIESPLIWNIDNLDSLLSNNKYKGTIKRILKVGDSYCESAPIVVTDKVVGNIDDAHYYCQTRGYYWENPDAPGEYVSRDGYRNPDYEKYDFPRLTELAKRCRNLSVAYYLSGQDKYYNAYLEQIKAWFIDKDTYMYPSFRYAGVLPNATMEKGSVTSLIQAYTFVGIIESIRLICKRKMVDIETLNSLKDWFRAFGESVDNDYGNSIDSLTNNIGLAYDITQINFFLFIDEIDKAKEVVESFANKRLYQQIASDGSQPLELKRAAGFSYSVYNLTHIIDFCFLAHSMGMDFYNDHCERIDLAFSYLKQFESDPKSFPYTQVSGWKDCFDKLEKQINRRERLRHPNQNKIKGKGGITISMLLE